MFLFGLQLDDNKDTSKEKDKEKDHNTKDNKEKTSLERKESVSEEKDSGSEKPSSESKDNVQSTVPVTSAPQHGSAHSEEKKMEGDSASPEEMYVLFLHFPSLKFFICMFQRKCRANVIS